MFIRHRRSEISPATSLNSPANFGMFPARALPFHNNPPVSLLYSPAPQILNEKPDNLVRAVTLYQCSRFDSELKA